MANFPLNLESVGVIVWARFSDQSGLLRRAKLVLDTGTASSVLSEKIARMAGYSFEMAAGVAHVQTLAGEEQAYTLRIPQFRALGVAKSNYLVACQPVHPDLDIDGVLGLDFFHGRDLLLGFASRRVRLD